MIDLRDFKTWLESKDLSAPISLGPTNQPTKEPHNVYTIWETGTLGTTLERHADRPTIQVLTRGANGRVTYELAKAFDDLMLNTSPQFSVGTKPVVDMGKISGPVNLGEDSYGDTAGQRNRTEFSANYYLEIER